MQHMHECHRHNCQGKKPATKEHIPYVSLHVKHKKKQNYSMTERLTGVVLLLGREKWREGGVESILGLEMSCILVRAVVVVHVGKGSLSSVLKMCAL